MYVVIYCTHFTHYCLLTSFPNKPEVLFSLFKKRKLQKLSDIPNLIHPGFHRRHPS
jgi:hypothetical protein